MHVTRVAHTRRVYSTLQENMVHENSCCGTMRAHACDCEVINEQYCSWKVRKDLYVYSLQLNKCLL